MDGTEGRPIGVWVKKANANISKVCEGVWL